MKSTAVDESLASMNQQFCSRENQVLQKKIFTLIFTIVKSHLFACKYAGKVPDPVECWNKILYYKDTEELIYLKHNKTTKFKAMWHPLSKI